MVATRLIIFIATYVLIAVQQIPGVRVNRPAASLLGAVAMVVIGGLPLRDAYAAIDLDVLVFLLGVLLLTAYLDLGGFFEWAAARVVRRARSPHALLAAVVVVSGVLSAFFINDTICLVLTPLVLVAIRPLGLKPLPFLLAIAMASNVGSAMTLTGNPQNMLIGVASGIHFARFLAALAPAALGGLAIVYGVIAFTHRRALAMPLATTRPDVAVSMDRVLVVKALVIFAAALGCWLAGISLPLVAITAGAVMAAIAQRDPAAAFARVEWDLLLFFAALFVVMRGVESLPLFQDLTARAAAAVHGAPGPDATIVSGAMLVLSNLVSNVPAVILWRPIVPHLPHREFLWLVIAMSSTFAGNLTLLGSMANLIVAGRAASRGESLRFLDYLRVGVPVTVLTTILGIVVLMAWRG
ncbi:MAG TPA: SLC13 family permease [Gemmatimonadaceae bacterium]|nr:SLC13 family permease [Gemmatimonadaceae bacterium]